MGRRAALAGCVAVSLVAAAACSGDDSQATVTTVAHTSAPTDTTIPSETTAAPDTVAPTTSSPPTTEPPPEPLARYAGYQTVHYDDAARWLCRPDVEGDFCDTDLSATVIEADGTTRFEPFEPAADPPVDCFYVYPTISRDETTYSDWEPSPDEEGYVVVQQAARLAQVCRVFAPVYRSRTLTALTAGLGGTNLEEGEQLDPFDDVLDAFRTYMARDNGGRGVVLIGHSQGSGMANRLIREEIDPHDDVRSLLVAAYLVGSTVRVPDGAGVGGDFQNVPLCSTGDATGCVLTWATFRATSPPPEGSFFGRTRDGEDRAGCVNPAAVEGGAAELDPYFPASSGASILGTLGTEASGSSWLPGVEISTPFVRLPGLVSGECVREGPFDYLSVTVHADPDGPRADDIAGDLTPEWGLHLVDVSIAMGDIVQRIAVQAAAFATAG